MKRSLAKLLSVGLVAPAVLAAGIVAGPAAAAAEGTTAADPTAADTTAAAASTLAGAPAIGSTAYPVPSGARFVSPGGSNAAAGTQSAPWQTVAHAVANTPAGGTIVLRGGTYHEQIFWQHKRLTLQAYPGEAVWFDGSQAVQGFVAEGSVWRRDAWTHRFDNDPRGQVTPDNRIAAHPDMVWVGGRYLRQVATRAEVRAGTFYYDEAASKLYIGDNPSAGVRASTLRYALYVNLAHGTAIRGIGFRRYATPMKELGAVRAFSDNMVVEDVVLQENATTGLSVIGADVTLRRVTARDNGDKGLHGHRSDRIRVESSLVSGNNREGFSDWASGGMKVTSARGLTFRDNVFRDNAAAGLWIDESALDAVVVNSAFIGNRRGLMFELSAGLIAANNLFVRNQDRALYVLDSNEAELWNNTLIDNGRHVAMVDGLRIATDRSALGHDKRYPEGHPRITWRVTDVRMRNNVLSGGLPNNSTQMLGVEDVNRKASASAERVSTDFNAYYRPSATFPQFVGTWTNYPVGPLVMGPSIALFRSRSGQEMRSLSVDGGSNPFVADVGGSRFHLPGVSPARGAGTTPPASVLSQVGTGGRSSYDIGLLDSRPLAIAGLAAPTPPPAPAPTPPPAPAPPPAPVAPGAPTSLRAQTVDGAVTLTWAAPTGDVARYILLEDGREVATVTTPTATRTDVGGVRTYAVKAVSAAGLLSPPSATLQVTVPQPVTWTPRAVRYQGAFAWLDELLKGRR